MRGMTARIGALVLSAVLLQDCGAATTSPSVGATASPTFVLSSPSAPPYSMLRSLPTTPSAVPTDLPDRAAMEAVVAMVKAGKFHAGQGQVGFDYRADLPPELARLSLDGSISIITNTQMKALTVVFYAVLPGGPDHYAGWVWQSSGDLSSDPAAGGPAAIHRIDAHWFWVVAY